MNKHDVREAVLNGKITLGIMRRSISAAKPSASWERSKVNKTLSREQALDILRNAVAADNRPDETVMNKSNRDVLIATNVIRECKLSDLLAK